MKNISYHWGTKTAAFILVCVLFGYLAVMAINLVVSASGKSLSARDYISTWEAQDTVNTAYNCVANLSLYKSEAYLRSDEYRNGIRGMTEEYKDIAVENDVSQLQTALYRLNNLEGIYYYAAGGETSYANSDMSTRQDFEKYDYRIIIEKGLYVFDNINGYAFNYRFSNSDYTFYFAFDNDFIAEKQAEFENWKQEVYGLIKSLAVVFLLGILALIYLIAVCGRKPDGGFSLMTIDRLWTDVNLVFLLLTMLLYAAVFATYSENAYYIESLAAELKPFVMVVSAVFCAIGLMLLLSLARRIKNRTFIKHSLTYSVYGRIKNVFKTLFDFTPLRIKIIAAVLIAELITFIFTWWLAIDGMTGVFLIFMPLFTAAALYFIIKHVLKPYDDEVESRLQLSLAKEMKAEKLKTELITNVSHDLKTPLTAIINYSDLLVKQDENNEYAKIIYEKSRKLQHLTEDLFEVSKAQSGNITVNMESLKVLELINQTLAEFDEPTVEFKINIPDVSIIADGKLMSRVVENLIGNIMKYSLPNTRAYIDAWEREGKICITFKNIANYEMNFESSEIAERFSRGDTARTTDGNGLGLAIAQSYVEACGGKLIIDVDGDLFKVTVKM